MTTSQIMVFLVNRFSCRNRGWRHVIPQYSKMPLFFLIYDLFPPFFKYRQPMKYGGYVDAYIR